MVAFLSVIFTVPVTQLGYELSQGEWPHVLDVFAHAPTEENLRTFESDLEEDSWVIQTARPHLRRFQFRLLNNPGNKVLMGRDGWLFYKPGVDYLVQRSEDDSSKLTGPTAAVQAIIRFRDQLAGRGIHLLVVPVPGKATIYPDKLTGRTDRSAIDSRTSRLIDSLTAAEVETVDLFQVFQESRETDGGDQKKQLYLARDTHWSPHGVQLAAKAIRDRIEKLGWLNAGSIGYRLQSVSIDRVGDIIRMMQLPNGDQHFTPDTIRCQQVLLQSTSYQDDPSSPILFLGDSFSRIYQTDHPGSAGLIAHLAHQLRMPLDSIVNDGGASTLVRQQLARRAGILSGKKLVIWQFVERDIRFGIEGWKAVPLPADPKS